METTAYQLGRNARKNGLSQTANPFNQIKRFTKLGSPVYVNEEDRYLWQCGFNDESAVQYKLNGGKPAVNEFSKFKRKANSYYGK